MFSVDTHNSWEANSCDSWNGGYSYGTDTSLSTDTITLSHPDEATFIYTPSTTTTSSWVTTISDTKSEEITDLDKKLSKAEEIIQQCNERIAALSNEVNKMGKCIKELLLINEDNKNNIEASKIEINSLKSENTYLNDMIKELQSDIYGHDNRFDAQKAEFEWTIRDLQERINDLESDR